MILKLTRAQIKTLQPLFDKASRAHKRGKRGVILAQPFGKNNNPPKYAGNMSVVFVKHELAMQLVQLTTSNKRQIVKR